MRCHCMIDLNYKGKKDTSYILYITKYCNLATKLILELLHKVVFDIRMIFKRLFKDYIIFKYLSGVHSDYAAHHSQTVRAKPIQSAVDCPRS